MAFEAVLAHNRGETGTRRPRRWRRAALVASVAVHVAALAVGVAYSFWQVDELPLPAVAVTLAATAPPPPPPPPAAAHKRSSSRPKTTPTQPKPETLVQPQEKPQPKPVPQPEPQEQEGAQQGGVEGGVKGGVQGGVVGGVVGAPVVKDPGPRMLPAQVGAQQLLTDVNDERFRVKLPPALERAGVTLTAVVRLCISAQGNVTEVRVLRGAGPAIDPQIPGVLGRWKYRPYTINGQPTPFCYAFRYEVSAR